VKRRKGWTEDEMKANKGGLEQEVLQARSKRHPVRVTRLGTTPVPPSWLPVTISNLGLQHSFIPYLIDDHLKRHTPSTWLLLLLQTIRAS
jgi:hypothetical protein